MRSMRPLGLSMMAAVAIAMTGGCTDLPPLSGDIAGSQREAGYPALVPARQITGQVPPPSAALGSAPALEERAARLRARAARLQRPVIDDATRERMRTGITQ